MAFSNVEGFNNVVRDAELVLVAGVEHVHCQVPVQVSTLNFSASGEVMVGHNQAAQVLLHQTFVEVLTTSRRSLNQGVVLVSSQNQNFSLE
jgi:hypothetical protein